MHRPTTKHSKGKGKAKAATPRASPHFLNIALELREIVYGHILRDNPSSLTNLLVVNRQLSTEVLPFQFKRHLTFDGQAELFDWLDNVDHEHLHNVVDVRFKLHDIDPSKIVGALGKRLRQSNIRSTSKSPGASASDNPYQEACDAEMKKLAEAFKLIPNVRKLTIATTDAGDPQPPQRMLSIFSRLLAHRFRYLETLISYEDALTVDHISNKPRLRRLRFPAISPSSNAEVAGVFANLSLSELEIYRLPHQLPPKTPKRRIIAQVLRSLPPLRSLLLFEEEPDFDEPDLIYEVFVHSQDAFARHKPSLRAFRFPAGAHNAVDVDEEWMVDSRTALRKFLREGSRRMRIGSLDSDTWDDKDAP
ncbi:hypothetical protein ACLMJK_004376 [Lecanora helva]